MTASLKNTLRLLRAVGLILTGTLLWSPGRSLASGFDLNYSGRLVDEQGRPITRALNLSVKFFNAALNGQQKIEPLTLLGVIPNAAGLFQLSLSIPDSSRSALLGYGDTYVEITDLDSNRTYPRQRLMAVPFALRVPVDEQTLQYDNLGRLKVTDSNKLQGREVAPTAPTSGQVLKWDGSKWTPGDISVGGGTATDWNTAYSERKQWDGSNSGLNASSGRTSLGLGALSTKDSISDADVASGAAIASSKINFTNVTISGVARNAAAIANAGSTIDFGSGNLQYTSADCGAFNVYNLKDGGSYTLTVKGGTVATCSFATYSDAGNTALTVHLPPDHTATTAGKHTLYTFLVVGGDVYVSWTPGY